MKKQIKITYLKKAAKFIKKNNLKEEEIDELVIRLIKIVKFNKEMNLDFKALPKFAVKPLPLAPTQPANGI